MSTVLVPEPLSAEAFRPYGDVIATGAAASKAMNAARFDRFADLARVDVEPGEGAYPAIGVVRARSATALPYVFDTLERHALGSQAFVPLAPFRFIVVVAPPGPSAEAADLRAFITNGRQGVNYHRGTWHMPLIALEAGQEFLVVDRAGEEDCEEQQFEAPLTLAMARS